MTICDKHRILQKSSKLLCLLLGLFFTACQDEKPGSFLNESELFFNEILSSISADPSDSDLFYIGTEDGVIYRYDASSGQVSDTLYTKFDRIYKVLRDTTKGREGTYWIGTRNMGLFRCEVKSDSLKPMEKQGRFFIHATNKATQYSAYDISVTSTGIYVATSHGLQKIQMCNGTITSNYLDILWPELYRPQERRKDLTPLVVVNIVKYNDSILYCASDSGLLCVKTSVKENDGLDCVKTLYSGKEFFNIVLRSDTLKGVYLLSKDSLYKLDENNVFHPYIENNQAQVYFYDSTCGTNYLLSTNHITLFEDNNSESFKKRHTISLKRPLRTLCHNIIVPDTGHGRILLLTEHSIMRIGNHQGILDSAERTTHACADGQYIYYLSGTRLFRQDISISNKNIQAKQIAEIHSKEVNFMIISNGVLYYVDGDNASFRMSLQNNLFLNTILPWAWKKETDGKTDNERDVTAIGHDSTNIYVGIRDGFRNINSPETLNLSYNEKESNSIKCSAPFITCFARSPRGGQTFLGTLNDGIYSGTNNKFSLIKGTKPDSTGLFSFIRDICIVPGVKDSIYILTNHKLIHQHGDSFRTENIDATGYYRLFVLDSTHIFGVKGFGITNLADGTTLYPDVQFNPKACVLAKGKLYAGSNGGVYVIDTTSKNTVHFVDDNIFTRQNLIILLLLLFFALAILWLLDRMRLNRQAIESRIEEIDHSISLLEEKKGLLSASVRQKIDELRSKLKDINPDGRKKALDELKTLRNEIAVTRRYVSEVLQNRQVIKSRKEELVHNMSILEEKKGFLTPILCQKIDNLRSTLSEIDPIGSKDGSKKMDKLGEDIGKIEHEVIRELRDILQRQIKDIERSNISVNPDHVIESKRVAEDLIISKMIEQIKSNEVIISIIKDINEYSEFAIHAIVIKGVTDNLKKNVEKAKKEIRDGHELPSYESLRQQMESLNTKKGKIIEYIDKQINICDEKSENKVGPENEKASIYIKNELTNIKFQLDAENVTNTDVCKILIHLQDLSRYVYIMNTLKGPKASKEEKQVNDKKIKESIKERRQKEIKELFEMFGEDENRLQEILDKAWFKYKKSNDNNSLLKVCSPSKPRDLLGAVMFNPRKDKKYKEYTADLCIWLGWDGSENQGYYKFPMSRLRCCLNKAKELIQTENIKENSFVETLIIDCAIKLRKDKV